MTPTIGQLRTLMAYLFVIATGVYIGYDHWGIIGGVFGAVAAVPAAILTGLFGILILSTLLGYDSRLRAYNESEDSV